MAQPIKYWSTTVPASKTAAQIQTMLREYGALSVTLHYDREGEPTGVSFVIHDEKLARDVPVHLEARVDAVYRLLEERKGYTKYSQLSPEEHETKQRARAQRIIWRHLKDLIEQQLVAVEIGAFELTDVFLAGVVTRGGETFGQLLRTNTDQLLESQGTLRLQRGE